MAVPFQQPSSGKRSELHIASGSLLRKPFEAITFRSIISILEWSFGWWLCILCGNDGKRLRLG